MQENYIVGIYARLSRDDERAGESVSIENQKEMLSRYVRELKCPQKVRQYFEVKIVQAAERACCL